MDANNLILIGAILAATGGIIAGVGGFMQSRHQAEYEKEMRLKAEATITTIQDTLNSVTGGDGYCYVQLQIDGGTANPVVNCDGKYPMYDINVRLYDPSEWAKLDRRLSFADIAKIDKVFSVGNMRPKSAAPIANILLDFRAQTEKRYGADIYARNGFFSEEILLKKVGDQWKRALRVFAGYPTKDQQPLFVWADEGFPKNDQGEIVWEEQTPPEQR